MGVFRKLFGGDEGVREVMEETYFKLRYQHPGLKEHEVLALVLHHRFRVLPPEVALTVSALFPTRDELTEWVIGLENSGLGQQKMTWPNSIFDRYLAATSTLEERMKALDFIQNNASDTIKKMM